MDSFVRKAAAITGLTKERVVSLIDFHPIMMGPPIRINGAEFRFSYTLHSIPSIGMECYFLGKSFVYSGDTLNSPEHIESMAKEGVLPEGRKKSLLNFPWHHNVIFHEAGVPPLHTPVQRLVQLPESVKKRLYLLHTARSSVPEDSGLKVADPGIENTIEVHVEKDPHSKAVELLTVLNSVELFRNFPLNRAADFLSIANVENFEAGELVLEEGDQGTKFYLIVSGSAEVKRDDTVLDEYGPNDYFGETAVVMDIPRTASVWARASLQCISIERADFLYFIRGSDVAMKLRRLFINRQLGLGDILLKTEPFCDATPTQRAYLETYMDSDFSMTGQCFAKEGDLAEQAFIVAEGEVTISKDGQKIVRVSENTFIADVDALLSGGKQSFTAEAMSNSRLFMISKTAILDFLDLNPGFYFKLTEYDGK
jgi:CRP-like cAMP-binding protein